MAEHAVTHTSRYKDTVFKSRLEARYAAFFDLAGWAWEYEPLVLNGWTPNFRVTFPCGHSECNATHILLVEVQPYFNISDFEGHPGNKYHWGWDYDKNVALPFDASACFGISPEVSLFMMTHGAGGGEDRITDWVQNWEALWETADSKVESAPRNFAARVLKELKQHLANKKANGAHFRSKTAEKEYLDTCRVINASVHFEVDKAALEPDQSKPIPDTLRLPYENITLRIGDDDCLIVASNYAFSVTYDDDNAETGTVEDAYRDGLIVVRVVLRDGKTSTQVPYNAYIAHKAVVKVNEDNGHRTIPFEVVKSVPHEDQGEVTETLKQFTSQCAANLLRFLHRLATTHTEEVIQQASPKNNRRILDGKLPIWEVKTLVLKTPVTRTVSEYQGGTHASPRQHIRRGHYRHYKSGKIAWVRDCIVGSLEKGFVHKDYRVEPAAA